MNSPKKSPPPPPGTFIAFALGFPRVNAITEPEPSSLRASVFHSLSPTSQPALVPRPSGSQTPSVPIPGIVAAPMLATARVLTSDPRAADAPEPRADAIVNLYPIRALVALLRPSPRGRLRRDESGAMADAIFASCERRREDDHDDADHDDVRLEVRSGEADVASSKISRGIVSQSRCRKTPRAQSLFQSGEALAGRSRGASAMATPNKRPPHVLHLYHEINAAAAHDLSPADLDAKLEEASEFLAGCLASYKPPSSASKAEVESGSISDYDGKTLKLNAAMKKVTIAASARLNLDEIQTYALMRRCVDEDKSTTELPTECDDDLVERLTDYYFRERLGMFKCIHALLLHSHEEDAAETEDPYAAPKLRCLERMMKSDLEANLVTTLCAHMRGETPIRPSATSASTNKAWSKQALEETIVMLECAFLVYFDGNASCDAKRFAEMATAFRRGALARAPSAGAELVRSAAPGSSDSRQDAKDDDMTDAHARAFTDTLRALCAVVLVAALDLESVVELVRGGGGGGSSADLGATHPLLSEGALRDVSTALKDWPSDASHGPVLLAWATLLALAPSARGEESTLPDEADPSRAASRVAGEAGYGALLSLLRLEQFRRSEEVIVELQKSVLKNMFTCSLAAFDALPVHKLAEKELTTLIDVLTELTSEQPGLCAQFWGGATADGLEAPLMSLLVGCRERHPVDAAPLLRVLFALAEGPESAEKALRFLTNLPTVALPAPPPGTELARAIVPLGEDGNPAVEWMDATTRWEDERGQSEEWRRNDAQPPSLPPGPVYAAAALASTYLPGACIPQGTPGVAMARDGSSTSATAVGYGGDDRDGDEAMTTTAPSLNGPGVDIIRWHTRADGVRVLIARVCVLSTMGGASVGAKEAHELDASLAFLGRVLRSAPRFATNLVSLDVSAVVPSGAPTSLVAALAAILTASTTPGDPWATLPCSSRDSDTEVAHPGLMRAALALSVAAPLAAAAPTFALEELTSAPLLRADGYDGRDSGALASINARGPAVGLAMFEHSVIPSERAAGVYPLTTALLRVAESFLWAGAGASHAMTPLLQHVVQEVLVQHGTWRYRRRADRWSLHAAVARVVTAALAPRPGPENAARRAAVAGYVSSDAGAAAALLAPLALDAAVLGHMHDGGPGAATAAEVIAAEEAVAATLRALPQLLSVLADSVANAAAAAEMTRAPAALGSGPLAHALLVDAPGGGPPLAAAVASYVAYPYAAACCALAFPALAAICAAAPNEPPLACALPSLAPSSLSASAFALTMHGEPRKKDAGAEMDPRAAIVRALTPDAARYAPGEALAAAAFITAAASSQPMLAESMLLPAKLSPTGEAEDGCDVESALDSLWTVLGNAKELREEDPRLLAASVNAIVSVWRGGRLLAGAAGTLRTQSSFASRLGECLPSVSASKVLDFDGADTDADDDGSYDDEREAFQLSAEAAALTLLASEAADVLHGSPGEGIEEAFEKWCGKDGDDENAFCLWIKRWCVMVDRPGVFAAARAHAQAVVLKAAASAERAKAAAVAEAARQGRLPRAVAGSSPLCDASLEHGAVAAADALLSHASAADAVRTGATRATILEATAAAVLETRPRPAHDPLGRLLEAAREIQLERAALAPPPPGPLPGERAEYGGDFLFNATWVEAATGGASPPEAAGMDELGDDDAFGAMQGPLSSCGYDAAKALRLAGRAAARKSAQLAALSAFYDMMTAAAGPMRDVASDDDEHAFEADQRESGLLSSWPVASRASAVQTVLENLHAALNASKGDAADHATAFAAELAHLLALLVRLWARAVNAIGAKKAPDDGETENLDAFATAAEVSAMASDALSRRPEDVVACDGAASCVVRPLLTAVLVSVRAWRTTAATTSSTRRAGSGLREGHELGNRLLPLTPVLCALSSSPDGGADAVLALAVLREMADGLVPASSLADALRGRALLPPLTPPPFEACAAPGVDGSRDPLAMSSLVALPFERLGDASAMALRPFLDVNAASGGFGDGKENVPENYVDGGSKVSESGVSSRSDAHGGAEVAAALRTCLALGRSPAGAEVLQSVNYASELSSLLVALGSTRPPPRASSSASHPLPRWTPRWGVGGPFKKGDEVFYRDKAAPDAHTKATVVHADLSVNPHAYVVDVNGAERSTEASRLAARSRVRASFAGGHGHAHETRDATSAAATPSELYCLALRAAATHADVLGARRDVHDAFVSVAVALADRFEEALAPSTLNTETLAEAESTAGFLHSLALAASGPWQLAAPTHQVAMRAAAVDFLRFIAAPPPPRRGIGCQPRSRREIAAVHRAPLVGAVTGWFHSCAIGAVPAVAPTPAAAIAAAIAASSDEAGGNAHSEAIAAALYATAARCAAFLASFPRSNPNAVCGEEALFNLSQQADVLKTEFERKSVGEDAQGRKAAFKDAMTHVAGALRDHCEVLETLEADEDPVGLLPPKLHSARSLVSQMSWRPTPMDKFALERETPPKS